MPLEIIIDPNQEYSSGSNTVNSQDWSVAPASPLVINYIMGESEPIDVDLDISIKDFLEIYQSEFTQYSIKGIQLGPLSGDVVDLQGDIPNATGDGYILTSLNLDTTITVSFINLNLAFEGSYLTTYNLVAYGKNSSGILQFLDNFELSIVINVAPPEAILFTPENFVFNHILSQALPLSQTLEIFTGYEYYLRIKDCFDVISSNILTTTNYDGFNMYFISGAGEVTITPNENMQSIDVGSHDFVVNIFNQFNHELANINLNIFEETFLEFSPGSFQFLSIKNIEEAQPQNLSISCPETYTISFPNFIFNDDASGNYTFNNNIWPINSDNLAPGIYIDNIVISLSNQDYLIPVEYTVAETVNLGLDLENINFTDDYNKISSFYAEDFKRILLSLKTKLYSYRFGFETEAVLDYSLSLFNNRVNEFLGKRIKNVMHEIESLKNLNIDSFNNTLLQDEIFFVRKLYKPAKLELCIEVYNTQTNTIDETQNFENIFFIAGKKPINSFKNTAILSYYNEPIRVTPNSQQLISYYKNKSHTIRVYRNGSLDTEYNQAIFEPAVYVLKHKFNNYTPGDVIEFRFHKNINEESSFSNWYENASNYISQKFFVFPEEKNSHNIVWENNNYALSSLEFTGSLTFSTGKEFLSIKTFKDFLEKTKRSNISKTQFVSINTGIILKNNAKLIDELTDALKAWVVFPDERASIALVPKTSKIITSDTDQGLYEYEVEFEINFNNDNEVYQ